MIWIYTSSSFWKRILVIDNPSPNISMWKIFSQNMLKAIHLLFSNISCTHNHACALLNTTNLQIHLKFRHVEKSKLTITKYLLSLYLIRTLTTLYDPIFLIHDENKFKMKWKGSKMSIDFDNFQKMKKCAAHKHIWFNVLFFNPNR